MQTISFTHDSFFRTCLSDKSVAKDFFKAHLPTRLLAQINLDSLKLHSKSFVSQALKESISDILYSVKIDKRPGYLYLLNEHQSTPDRMMPLRILKYTISIFEQHKKQYPHSKKLPLVYPLVFYHGNLRPYPYSNDIYDCFESPDLARDWVFKPFQLIDVSQLSDEAIQEHGLASLFELLQKHIYLRDFNNFFKQLIQNRQFNLIYEQEGRSYFISAIYYGMHKASNVEVDEYLELLAQHFPKEEESLMTGAEQLRQQGFEKGIIKGLEQGLEQGVEQTKCDLINTMLKKGLSDEFIMDITGITIEKLESIKFQTED